MAIEIVAAVNVSWKCHRSYGWRMFEMLQIGELSSDTGVS